MTNTLTISREQLRQEFEAANSDRAWFVQGGTSESDTPEGFVYGDFTTDMCWTCYFEARQRAAPVFERQEPVGAIENGRIFKDRVEQLYLFKDEYGHPLLNCSDWQEFAKCFEYLAEHTSPPAPVAEWVKSSERDPKLADLDAMGRVLVWNEFSQFAHLLHVDHLYAETFYTHWQKLPESPNACLDKVKEMNR